jgi:hypothetical protein
MTTLAASTDSRGFFEFYREYAQTGIHAATAAALTGLIGLGGLVHPAFGALAIAVYTLPPIYFYLNDDIDPLPGSDLSSSPAGETTRKPEPEATATRDAGGVDSPEAGPAAVSEPSESDSRGAAAAGGEGSPDDGSVRPSADADRTGGTEATRDDPVEADANTDTETGPGTDTTVGTDVTAETDTDAETGAETGPTDSASEFGTDTDSEAEDTGAEAEVGAEPDFEIDWVEVDSPVNVALHDTVAIESAAYAAGDSGVVLARRDGWEVLLDDGPAADANPLRGIDYAASGSDDGGSEGDGNGEVLWVAGDSGVVGRYDPAAGGITDFSAPNDQTSTWTDVAVAGPAGGETVHLANGSGAVLRGEYDEENGAVEWGELDKPGSGSSITAIVFRDREVGYCCDSSGGVHGTNDGGTSYETVNDGDAGVTFADLAPVGDNGLLVAGEDGSLFQYNGSARTRRSLSDAPLRAIDTAESGSTDIRGVAGDGTGTIHEFDGEEWTPIETPAGSIHAVAIGGSGVAIGDDGEILERERTRDS